MNKIMFLLETTATQMPEGYYVKILNDAIYNSILYVLHDSSNYDFSQINKPSSILLMMRGKQESPNKIKYILEERLLKQAIINKKRRNPQQPSSRLYNGSST